MSTTHERQRLFDDELGFRARNQDGRCRFEVKAPELSNTDDVGRWLVTLATRDPLGELRLQPLGPRGLPIRE